LYVSQNIERSNAQLFQDLLALFLFQEKEGGYFVEFGAANGELLSNTLLLEKQFGWTGILAEPARGYHQDLRRNRSSAIDFRCVYAETGVQLEFIEADEKELSSLKSFHANDHHHEKRLHGTQYQVETVSLADLLQKHDAPTYIDFISIDTEGSELSILGSFDFSRFKFGLICIEHNYTALRADIYSLLRQNGYVRIFSEISGFDDWYVDPERANLLV
jgi:FkbM family methyltransferase